MFKLEPHIELLAKHFAAHDMKSHLALLRSFYQVNRQRARAAAAQSRPPWEVDMVLDWLFLLRVPPFVGFYTVLPRSAPCPCGQSSHCNSFGGVNIPGGSTWLCGACGKTWLVLRDQP